MFYCWEREREWAWAGEEGQRERETHTHRHTESEAGFRLPAVSTEPNAGLEPMKPWDHDLSQSRTLNRLSHPGAPFSSFLNLSVCSLTWYLPHIFINHAFPNLSPLNNGEASQLRKSSEVPSKEGISLQTTSGPWSHQRGLVQEDAPLPYGESC